MKDLTLKVGRPFGWRFCGDNQVAPILRMGLYDRVKGPGFFWINPITETDLPPIKLGLHVANLTFDEVLTQDCVACRIHVGVLFNFNPNSALKSAATQLVQADASTLYTIVRDYTNNGIRPLVARFEAKTLSGVPRLNIQRDLTHFLTAEMRPLGIAPLRQGGVLLKEIFLDEDFKQPVLKALQLQTILQLFALFPDPVLVAQAIQAVFRGNLEGNEATILLSDLLPGEAAEASHIVEFQELLKQKARKDSKSLTGL